MSYTIEYITSYEDFLNLETEWKKIFDTSSQAIIFNSFEWIDCCIKSYQSGKQLLILEIRKSSEIVGFIPLWRYRARMRGIPVNMISFVTSPDNAYNDSLIVDDHYEQALDFALSYLVESDSALWDVLSLNEIEFTSDMYRKIAKICTEKNLKHFQFRSAVTPVINTEGDWEEFYASKSRKFRKTRRNLLNRLEKYDDVSFDYVKINDSTQMMEAIQEVSAKGWKHEAGYAISSRSDFTRFFNEFTPIALKNDWLRLWFLKIKGEPVAMEYDLVFNNVIYALRADFKPEFKELSPGSILEYHVIKSMFENEIKQYRTGPGLNEYKLHWTRDSKENYTYNIYRNTNASIIWFVEVKLKPVLKNIMNIFRSGDGQKQTEVSE